MTKMAATTIYGKTRLKSSSPEQESRYPKTWYEVMGCCDYLVYSNDDPRVILTYKTSSTIDQICVLMHFNGNSLKW